jgi:predicted nucleic acid-binding Zn ribbon protein
MSGLKFCPGCGAPLTPEDRFCGECGFDTNTMAEKPVTPAAPNRPAPAPPAAETYQPQQHNNQPPQTPAAPYAQRVPPEGASGPMPGRNSHTLGTNPGGNKKALMIMVSALALILVAGGVIYWWLSKDDPGVGGNTGASGQTVATNGNPTANVDGQNETGLPAETNPKPDLSRAATYLSEPGLKCTFFVNYPDGMSGIVDRYCGQAVPNESVRVSEVEVGIDMGEEYGFGFHYVERADGTYYILDASPYEIFPVLKNNLTVGQTWSYDTEYGSIKYEVMDMGVDLDLGFAKLEGCLLLLEDNQAVGHQSITYYAPGWGSVYVVAPGGNSEYFKMTGMTKIDLADAANTIKKWCPNYLEIKDDRAQSF